MKELLVKMLESLGYPAYLQGTMSDEDLLKPSYVTYFTLAGDDAGHFDNEPSGVAWRYTVIFYSSDPRLVASAPNDIRVALKAAGFIPRGRGTDIPSDEPTHTGWAMEFYHLDMGG